MWLLIVSIVLLLFSGILSAYYASCLGVARHERPPAFWRYERFLTYGNTIFFLAGIIMLFTSTGWKWGLAGLAIYWLLVVFVLMQIAERIRNGKYPGF